MGLTSALYIGRSALSASQVALQTTGNNLANAATPGYSRQVVHLNPTTGQNNGDYFVGRGVSVEDITRSVDEALLTRLRSGISQESAARTDLDLLSSVESILGELSETDLSSQLSEFFNSWSELANSPNLPGARSLVIEQGVNLASFLRTLRTDLSDLKLQIDNQLASEVNRADELLTEIATLNKTIVTAEAGSAKANSLRDQRDTLLSELSELIDVTTVEQPSGIVDVFVSSLPVVLAGNSRGVELDRETNPDTGELEVSVRIRDDGSKLNIRQGVIGSRLTQRDALINDTIAQVDEVASQLIFEVNKLHSTGYALAPQTSITSTRTLQSADTSLALNDPANASLANLSFAPTNGGFDVVVTNATDGTTQRIRIDVDLDGIDSSGNPGFADDTSVNDIAAAINSVANLSASVNPDGTIQIDAGTGFSVSFADDTSGALAYLGVNAYFTGKNATDIALRDDLKTNSSLLVTGRIVDGTPSDNTTAVLIAQLQDSKLDALNGQSIRDAWLDHVQNVAVKTNAAVTRADATTLVRESLDAQRAGLSGVSVDEESINLITYQRQYQGAARFISVIDQLTDALLALV